MANLPANVEATDLNQLANMVKLQAVLERMIKNLQLISTGNTGRSIIVFNANLFVLACQYYNDATKWNTIAQANGLVDPQIYSNVPVRLIIPETAQDNGGVYQV